MIGRPRKTEENEKIVRAIDEAGLTFREAASAFGKAVSTIHERYKNTKMGL